MKPYLDLMQRVLNEGTRQSNRTGIDTLFVPGDMMKFDLQQGFPVVTTRKAAWKSAIGEMIGFIRGETNAAAFRDLKCKFWDQNANENKDWLANPHRKPGLDDLGEIYGFQWRNWLQEDGTTLDQLANAISQIQNNPTSRRILVSAWRPDRFDRMALPPCHVMFQFLVNVEKKELNMSMFIRSNDLFLGAPANICEYAFLLEAVAHATGYRARWLTYFVSDCHVYTNHLDVVNEQLARTPYALPKLKFLKPYDGSLSVIEWLESLHPDNFELDGYQHHPALTAPMAV
jgi:thymidylate synthase